MADVVALAEGSEAFAAEVASFAGDQDGLVYALDCSGIEPPDAWSVWVEGASEQLLLDLSARARERGTLPTLLAVVRTSNWSGAAASWRAAVETAALEAARGVMLTMALELAAEGTRANTLVVDRNTSERDTRRTVRSLLDDERGGFTTGATLRLGHATVATLPTGGPAATPAQESRQRALVTGGAGGIGFATAEALARAGYEIVLSDVSAARLEEPSARLGATALPLDVADRGRVRVAAQSEQLRDGIQALAVAHGVAGARGLRDLDRDFVRRNLVVNGTAVAVLVEELLPLLERGAPSSVAIVASQAGIRGEAGNSAYCAAKFAVVGLVQGLAPLLLPRGVRIHALCPGCVETPLLASALEGFAEATGVTNEEVRRQRAAGIPLGRFATPEEMGEAMAFLCQLDHSGLVFASTGAETQS